MNEKQVFARNRPYHHLYTAWKYCSVHSDASFTVLQSIAKELQSTQMHWLNFDVLPPCIAIYHLECRFWPSIVEISKAGELTCTALIAKLGTKLAFHNPLLLVLWSRSWPVNFLNSSSLKFLGYYRLVDALNQQCNAPSHELDCVLRQTKQCQEQY